MARVEECGAGTGAGLCSCVGPGHSFPHAPPLRERGGQELGLSRVNTTYSSRRGMTAPEGKISEACLGSALPSNPSPLYDFFFISKFYTGFRICFPL